MLGGVSRDGIKECQRFEHKPSMTELWTRRMHQYSEFLSENIRPFYIMIDMKLSPTDVQLEEIFDLDVKNKVIAAAEIFLRYLTVQGNLSHDDLDARWSLFDEILQRHYPWIYNIVSGKCKMEDFEMQKRVVNHSIKEICRRLDPEILLPDLKSKRLLGDFESEELTCILHNRGPSSGAFYMVSHLYRSANPNWYRDFLDILKDHGYSDLVETLHDKEHEMRREGQITTTSGTTQEQRALQTTLQIWFLCAAVQMFTFFNVINGLTGDEDTVKPCPSSVKHPDSHNTEMESRASAPDNKPIGHDNFGHHKVLTASSEAEKAADNPRYDLAIPFNHATNQDQVSMMQRKVAGDTSKEDRNFVTLVEDNMGVPEKGEIHFYQEITMREAIKDLQREIRTSFERFFRSIDGIQTEKKNDPDAAFVTRSGRRLKKGEIELCCRERDVSSLMSQTFGKLKTCITLSSI